MSERFGEPVLLDRETLLAAIAALGERAYDCEDLPTAAEATWTALARAKGIGIDADAHVSGEELEEALHELGSWSQDPLTARCRCGERTRDIAVRVSQILAGEPTETLGEEWARETAPGAGSAYRPIRR